MARVDIATAPPSLGDVEVLYQSREALVSDPPQIHLDGTVAYTMGGSMSVPPSPGVYLIHDLRGVLYVGRTSHLHRRFSQHYVASHNDRVSKVLRRPMGRLEFSWMISELGEQEEVERDLIRAIQPLCNRMFYRSN
jgi:predicted GIY-YIG superfamily endonuclease